MSVGTLPLVPYTVDNVKVMTFVDGENLAIRFGAWLASKNLKPPAGVLFREGICAWRRELSGPNVVAAGAVIRTHYYTALQGDYPTLTEVEDELREVGVEAPRVFKKNKGKSKRVDVSLTTDMLTHAARHHFDIGVLVAGDEDYVPLVRAVQNEGRGVHVWFLRDGLSDSLRRAADTYRDLTAFMWSGE